MGGLRAQTLTKTSYPGIEKQEIPSQVSNLYFFLLLKPSKYMLLLISCILNHY
jgi:hypothetical protein